MKFLLSFLSLFFVGHILAGPRENFINWIDSTVQSYSINWETVQSEFENYTQNNYTTCKTVAFFLKKTGYKKSTLKIQTYRMDVPKNYPTFRQLGEKSKSILSDLEVYLLELIKTNNLQNDQNFYTYIWLYLNHINYMSMNGKTPYVMRSELYQLKAFTGNDESLFEKISLILLAQKLFSDREYQSDEETLNYIDKTKVKYGNDRIKKMSDLESDSNDLDSTQFVEVEPQFIGGIQNMVSHINLNVVYPSKCQEMNQQGIVFVQFIIDKSGEVRDVEIIKGVHPLLDKEAFRVVSIMPDWIPGMQNYENVNVRFTLPINFRLS